ncbi:MAG: hypothetical protein JSS02_35555 [Planctomycetes bacterium]|nr:hypothetical protein [Planctomycetota bacterium]
METVLFNQADRSCITIRNGQVVSVDYPLGQGPTTNAASQLLANEETPLPVPNWVENSRSAQPSAPVLRPLVTDAAIPKDVPLWNVAPTGSASQRRAIAAETPLPIPDWTTPVVNQGGKKVQVLKDSPSTQVSRQQGNYGQPVVANGGRGASGDDETPLPLPNWGGPAQRPVGR